MPRSLGLLAAGALFWHSLSTVYAQDSCSLSALEDGDDSPALLKALSECSQVDVPEDVTLTLGTFLNTTDLHDVTLVSGLICRRKQIQLTKPLECCWYFEVEG
jgi:hypothetical protein